MERSIGTLSCTILDRRSSFPLSGARVTCVGRDARVTTLRLDGAGSVHAKLPQGAYDLVISAHGYLSLLLRGIGVLEGHEFRLLRALVPGEGERIEGEPATAVGGFLRDRLDRPARNVSIHLTREGGGYTARTEQGGAYIMHGVLPGTYDVTFRRDATILHRQAISIAHVRSFVRLDAKLLRL